jgi:hypothetical protein
MGNQSSPVDIKVEYDNSSGTPVDITQYVLTLNGVEIEQVLEEVRAFGSAWQKYLSIGVGKIAAIVLGGIWDDTATTGPDALFANRIPELPSIATRTLTITWFGTKTTEVETLLQKYKRTPDKNALTKYEVTLQPSDEATEA